MKKFCLVSLAAIGLWLGACTTSNRFLGSDMIPPSQQLSTMVDTLRLLSTYQITFDSITGRVVGASASSVAPYGYIGSMIDPLVGRTTNGLIANFIPDPYTKNTDWQQTFFGTDPTLDSLKLTVVWNDAMTLGDTTQRFKVSVYPINERLRMGKDYHVCFNPSKIYDPTRPVVEFVTDGKKPNSVRLPAWYADAFLTAEHNKPGAANPYSNDSIFLDTFKGLYFKVEPVAPGTRGLMGALNLDLSQLSLHYHNKNAKSDTLSVVYCFYYVNENTGEYYTPQNTAFVVAQHDYSLATAPGKVEVSRINNRTEPCSVGFVQGLGGLAVLADVDMNQINALRDKAKQQGFRHIGLHRAELRWKVPERSVFYYDDSFRLLVLGRWRNSLQGINPIPDYNPWSATGVTSIGGNLTRSLGYYSQDITSTMQAMLNGTPTSEKWVLLPDFGGSLDVFSPLRSAVGGSSGPEVLKPELILVYTLIR